MENTTIQNLLSIIDLMTEHYEKQAEESGMDFGGEYEYQELIEIHDQVLELRKQVVALNLVDMSELPVYVQLKKIHHQPFILDFDTLEMMLNDYYDIQNRELHKIKETMHDSVAILSCVQRSQKYWGDNSE